MFWSWTENTPQPGDVIQADDRGVPGWVPTTGIIPAFHGAPKTPGFPHYLDGLPMSVVSQLGYVDRGIGKRGIAVLFDDFTFGAKSAEDGVPGADNSTDRWQVHYDGDYSFPSFGRTYPYFSGALTLVTYGGLTPAVHKGIGVNAWASTFNFIEGRQMWFSARVAISPESGASLAPGLAAIGVGDEAGTTIHDRLAGNNGTEGLFFYKGEGDTDWSFVVAEYSGVVGTSAILASHLVETARGSAPVSAQYVPLAFRVLPDATIVVYVDGNVVATVPAAQPTWASLRSYQTDQPSARPWMNAELGDSHPVSVDDSHQIGLRLGVDNILVAEETQADAD